MMLTLLGTMCPFMAGAGRMSGAYGDYDLICFGIKIFLLVWVVAVPVIITSRLDKIVKLLQDKK